MKNLDLNEVVDYVEKNIGLFHQRRLQCLERIELHQILKRKNPYLFKSKDISTSEALVKTILDVFLSSHEETIFGEFLEGLAIFICGKIYGGRKSSAEGIDLEFEKENIKYIVTIKSGPNWGNSGQINKMRTDFKKAKKILGTNAPKMNIVAVNGCCYGRDNQPDKGDYLKYCGQKFWEFISGNENLYIQIIEPLGHKAKERNKEFVESYTVLINKFTFEFAKDFVENGKINWEAIVRFNSSINKEL